VTQALDDAAPAATYEVVDPQEFPALIPALADLIVDAVDSGASVNFVRGFSRADGEAWWSARTSDVNSGRIRPIVARLDGQVVGVVLLVPSPNPNAPHRAEVNKVIVDRRARGRGIATGLMLALEDLARREGRWLLLLDTTTGSDADHLYRRLGWTAFGEVPNHALTSDGALSDTTYFFKDLRP
jgi:GNAT superfamily N-acetyltransferase